MLLGKYGQIVRAKGFIPLKDETLYADLVEKQITLSGLSPEEAKLLAEEQEGKEEVQAELTPNSPPTAHSLNKFVIIGKNLQTAALHALSRKNG